MEIWETYRSWAQLYRFFYLLDAYVENILVIYSAGPHVLLSFFPRFTTPNRVQKHTFLVGTNFWGGLNRRVNCGQFLRKFTPLACVCTLFKVVFYTFGIQQMCKTLPIDMYKGPAIHFGYPGLLLFGDTGESCGQFWCIFWTLTCLAAVRHQPGYTFAQFLFL